MTQKEKVLDILYPHQRETIDALQKNDKGKVILPTGTGKTFIQAANICLDILDTPFDKEKNLPVHIVQAPRILLSYQLLYEVYGFLNMSDVEANYLVVHSGSGVNEETLLEKHNPDIDWIDISVSTTKSMIEEEIEKSIKLERPLVILQTYHSADKTFDVLEEQNIIPRTVQNDECQYLVTENFHHLLDAACDRFYSFTATQKDAHHIGMQNEEKWGPILKKMSPREAIDLGIMVRPRLIHMTSKESISKEDSRKSFSRFIESDWEALNNVNPKVNNKLLVKTRGTDDMNNFIHSDECESLMEMGIHIFAVGSNERIDNWYNGETFGRTEWLKTLQFVGKDENSQMIVLHFDILSEGIDVPGFTAISLYSAPLLGKLIQNYGRVARLSEIDRERLKRGEIAIDNLDDWIKPYAFVITHDFSDVDKSQSGEIVHIISNLREYGFDPRQEVTIVSVKGVWEEEDPDDLLDEDDKKRIKGELVDRYLLNFRLESEKDAKLAVERGNTTLQDSIKYFKNLFG